MEKQKSDGGAALSWRWNLKSHGAGIPSVYNDRPEPHDSDSGSGLVGKWTIHKWASDVSKPGDPSPAGYGGGAGLRYQRAPSGSARAEARPRASSDTSSTLSSCRSRGCLECGKTSQVDGAAMTKGPRNRTDIFTSTMR